MDSIVRIIFTLFSFFCLSWHVTAQERSPNDLELVTGLPKPPFILENSKTGLQLDLISEAFATQNMNIDYVSMPLGRNITGFQRGNVDGVITVPPSYKYPSMYVSKPYINYQNIAVTLSDSHIELASIKDLSAFSIIAFQNAKKFLGDEFADIAAYSVDYRELANQKQQFDMLFSRRAEVIILDVNIFKYFVRKYGSDVVNSAFEMHYLFPEREYSIGFKKKEHMEAFNEGLQTIIENGTYQVILDNYLL